MDDRRSENRANSNTSYFKTYPHGEPYVDDVEELKVWFARSHHQRRADILDYLPIGTPDTGPPYLDRIEEHDNLLAEAWADAHQRHAGLHRKLASENAPASICDDKCAQTYLEDQQTPTGAQLSGDPPDIDRSHLIGIAQSRLRSALWEIEEQEKSWIGLLSDLRRESRDAGEPEIDDLPF